MEWAVSIVSSVVGPLVTKALDCVNPPIKNRLKYCTGHEERVESLKDQVGRLKGARQEVQDEVEAAQRKGELIKDDVKDWLTKVDNKLAEVGEVLAFQKKKLEQVMKDEEEAKAVAEVEKVMQVKGNRIHTEVVEIKFRFLPGYLRRRSQSVIGILPFLMDALTN